MTTLERCRQPMRLSASRWPAPAGAAPTDPVDRLRHAGLRVTRPRLAVLDLVEWAPSQVLYPEDIYRRMLERQHRACLTTVYRVLSDLADSGLLLRGHDGQGRAFYRMPPDPALADMRFDCPKSGTAVPFADAALRLQLEQLALAHGIPAAPESTIVIRFEPPHAV